MRFSCIVSILAAGFLAVACSKEDASLSALPVRSTSQAAAEATNDSAASLESATRAPEAEILGGVDSSMKALSGKDYVGASVALLKVDTKELTEKSGPAYRAAMAKLQSTLAQAAAGGDPKATEALQLLRATARH